MQFDFSDGLFKLNGKPFYMNSGEFHYFRIPQAEWKKRMKLFKEMGGNTISTYIPWLIHEPAEGQFDFDSPQLNLRHFLDCAAEMELAVIVRPGPYQYSELIYDGLPPWLCMKYPEILARDRHGRVMHYSAVSYLHEKFIEKVSAYFDRVCPIIAGYSAQKNGPVIMVQPDNELGGVHLWRGDFDCNRETMGFGCDSGRFAVYLRQRFGSVEQLNRRYGCSHTTFGEFGPPPDTTCVSPSALLQQRDYADFYWHCAAEYLKLLIELMENRGVVGPFCHNSANPAMNCCFYEVKKQLGNRMLLGSDHYYTLDQRWPQNNPTPQYAIRCFISLEQLRLMDNPSCVLEFPYGSLSDWPPITAEDVEACAMMHLGFGMRGHNGYIFTGGMNVPGTGSTTDMYDYNAPVSADGETRPTYYALQRFAGYLNAHPEIIESQADSDFRILMPWNLAYADNKWSGVVCPGTVGATQAWNSFVTGLVTSAFAAGLMPEMVNPESDEWVNCIDKPLVLWNNGCVDQRQQQKLVHFIENGGRLLCLPVIPKYDENFEKCTVLADYLEGATAGKAVSPSDRMVRLNIAGIKNVYCNNEFYPAENIPSGAEIIGQNEFSGETVGWYKNGFMFLGLNWCHGKNEHAAMIAKLLERLGMQRRIVSNDSWIITVLRKHAAGTTLFAMNLSSSTRTVTLQIRPDGTGEFYPPEIIEIPAMTVVTKNFITGGDSLC